MHETSVLERLGVIVAAGLATVSFAVLPAHIGAESGGNGGADNDNGDSGDTGNGPVDHDMICHLPPGNPDNEHTITVGEPAVDAHVGNHGDTMGPCDATTSTTTTEPPTTTTSTTAPSTTVPSTTVPPTTAPPTTIPPTTVPTPPGGFPNASNTGVPDGVTLTPYSGPTSPAAGTVIDAKLITECLEITEPGVVIRRSRIQASCDWVVDASITTGQANWLLIEDSEIICVPGDNVAGLGERGFTARRIEILGCTNGVDGDQNFTIEDSYIHSLNSGPNDEGHGDGIQTCCAANVIIRHNTILGRSGDLSGNGSNTTSAIILPIANPPSGPILITNNFLAGGSFTLYCASTSNQSILNNTFAHRPGPLGAEFGYVDNCQQASQFSGNVTDTGQPVNR